MDSGQVQLYAQSPSQVPYLAARPGHMGKSELTYRNRRRQPVQTPSFQFNPNNKFTRDAPPRTAPMATMNGAEVSVKPETMPAAAAAAAAAPAGVWTTPSSQGMRPRPATIHEGFSYCMGEEYGALPSWDSSGMPMQQTPSDAMSRPMSVHQEFYTAPPMENSE